MIYGLIYRLEFINVEGFTVRVDITATDVLIDDSDPPQIITLTGADQPLVISVNNNDQDKFEPIRSKIAKIVFVSDSGAGLDISTFSQGSDNLWKVDIYLQDTPQLIFTGFLIMADNQMPFQPSPEYVTLTATDHLGVLKDIPLVDLVDVDPVGKYRVAELVAMCLRKTGLNLNIYVSNNLKPGGGQYVVSAFFSSLGNYVVTALTDFFYPHQEVVITGTATHDGTYTVDYVVQTIATEVHFVETIAAPAETATTTFVDSNSALHWMDNVYMEAKTFEASVDEFDDCHTVLKKILGEDCFVTQYKGNWWICRVDEINTLPVYLAEFNSSGTYVTTAAGTNYDIAIGRNESFKFANADTLLRFIRPHKFIKETFNYDIPQEIPCNIDLLRGDFIEAITPTDEHYELDCWQQLEQPDPPAALTTAGTSIYRRVVYNVNETEDYVVIEAATPVWNLIYSEDIPVNQNDRFKIGMTRRLSADIGGSAAYLDKGMQVRLTGNDGTYWTLDGKETTGDVIAWVASDANYTINNKYFYFVGNTSRDMTEPEDLFIDGDLPPCPVDGVVNLLAFQSNFGASVDTYITNLDFEFIPFINGRYVAFKGQYSRVDRLLTGYEAKQDNEVYISDSPHPILKGAMFLKSLADLYTGSVIFGAVASFQVSGNQLALFRVGTIVTFTGTANNNVTGRITDVNYLIIGDVTIMGLSVATTSETVAATIQQGRFNLFPVWYSSQEFATGYPTNTTYLHPYGYIQAFSVWNQYKGVNDPATSRGLGINIFSGSVLGLTDNWPDMIHRYTLTDLNVQTNDRYFMLLSMEQNWKTCIWTATVVEVYNSTVGKTYDDTFEFKIIPE